MYNVYTRVLVISPYKGSKVLCHACILGLCRVQQGQPAAAGSALKKALQLLGAKENAR